MRRRTEETSEPVVETPTAPASVDDRIPAAALARFVDLQEGESVSITLGEEMYSPVKYRHFSVGPFSGTVVVRPGETGADAAMRLYRVLLELNEAEFQIAWGRHKSRLEKTGGER